MPEPQTIDWQVAWTWRNWQLLHLHYLAKWAKVILHETCFYFMMRTILTSLMIFNPNTGGKPEERGELSTFTCLATLWTGKHDSIKYKRVNFHNYNASIAIAPMCQIFKIIMIESQDHNPSCFRGKDNLTSNMMGEVMRQVKTQKRVKLGWWTKCIYWCVSGFRGRWHNHHGFQFPSLWEISQPLLSRTGKKRSWERTWIKRRNDQIADIRLFCNSTTWLFWGRLRFFIGSHTKSSVWK